MAITTAGKTIVAQRLIGTATNAYDATNGRIGVGDSSTAFTVGDTDLIAASNKLRKVVDSTPGQAANVLTFVATFGTSEANWAWNEWGLFNTATAAQGMLSRKVASHGTKASGDSWTMTATITVG
jgi:hypothetical protein